MAGGVVEEESWAAWAADGAKGAAEDLVRGASTMDVLRRLGAHAAVGAALRQTTGEDHEALWRLVTQGGEDACMAAVSVTSADPEGAMGLATAPCGSVAEALRNAAGALGQVESAHWTIPPYHVGDLGPEPFRALAAALTEQAGALEAETD